MLNRKLADTENPQENAGVSHPGFPPTPFAAVPPTGKNTGRGNDGNGGNDACRLVESNLSAYQDDELDSDQRRVIEVHLKKCATCAANLDLLRTTDRLIEREWRESAPLPSSARFKQSVDAIMNALPPVPGAQVAFAPRRVHSRARWMRFSTGLLGLFAFAGMLWSSYRLGYARGRMSIQMSSNSPSPSPVPNVNPASPVLTPIAYNSPSFPSEKPPLHSTTATQEISRR